MWVCQSGSEKKNRQAEEALESAGPIKPFFNLCGYRSTLRRLPRLSIDGPRPARTCFYRGIYDERSMLRTPRGGGRDSSGDGSAGGGGRGLAIRAEDQATTSGQLLHLRECEGARQQWLCA